MVNEISNLNSLKYSKMKVFMIVSESILSPWLKKFLNLNALKYSKMKGFHDFFLPIQGNWVGG